MNNQTRKNRASVRYLTAGAIIAALYTALTMLCAAVGLSSSAIQVRISEGLCVLTFFTPAAVPGMWLGCLISNLLTPGTNVWDIVFGSLATLIGALGGYVLAVFSRRAGEKGQKRRAAVLRYLIPLPTVVSNVLIIPFILKYAYGLGDAVPFLMLTVGAGEIISAWGIGLVLLGVLYKRFGTRQL